MKRAIIKRNYSRYCRYCTNHDCEYYQKRRESIRKKSEESELKSTSKSKLRPVLPKPVIIPGDAIDSIYGTLIP